MESSQEEENIYIPGLAYKMTEAFNRHLERLSALTDEYEQNGDSQ